MKILQKLFLLFFIFSNLYAFENLPKGYKDITLGMSLEETKTELIKDSDFGYHGDRDVSLTPNKKQYIIETDASSGLGSNFLEQCYFQFNQDSLYIITINLNKERMDYYSIFKTLSEKYGNPNSVNPKLARWEDEEVIVTLEKPLCLKYMDKKTFNELQNYSNISESANEQTKKLFLEGL